MIATTHGLDSITVGALATATGVSKSGILTVFGNREAIQLAAVAEATNGLEARMAELPPPSEPDPVGAAERAFRAWRDVPAPSLRARARVA